MTAPATTIGYAALALIPSLDGFSAAVDKQLGGSLKAVGTRGGKQWSAGVAAGVKASESEVKKAFDNHAKLADKAADATDKLKVAQAGYDELVKKGITEGKRFEAAKAATNKATRDEARAVKTATDALKDYEQTAKSAQSSGDKAGKSFTSGLRGAAGEASSIGRETAGGFFDGFAGASALTRIGSAGGPVGIALAGLAVLGVGVGNVLAQNISAGMEQVAVLDKFQARLGVDDGTMAKYGKAAAKSYTDNFGASVEENLQALQFAKQSGLIDTKTTEADTQKVIEQIQGISSVTDAEGRDVTRALSQLVRTGLAQNVTEASDLIVAGFQNGLDVSDDFLDSITEYSTQFRALGLSSADTLGLLKQGLEGGARDTDLVSDALKEFAIRAKDGSKTTKAAFEALHLDAGKTMEAFAKGGPEARAALDKVLDKIHEIPDAYDRGLVQSALFGTQSEDLQKALNNLDLKKAKDEIGDFGGLSNRTMAEAADNAKSEWDEAGRHIEQTFADLQKKMADWFAFLPGMINSLYDDVPHPGPTGTTYLNPDGSIASGNPNPLGTPPTSSIMLPGGPGSTPLNPNPTPGLPIGQGAPVAPFNAAPKDATSILLPGGHDFGAPGSGGSLLLPGVTPGSGGQGALMNLQLAQQGAAGALPGESARDYAHRVAMPFWQGQGLTVGDHAADKYGEHQNGALDLMVDSIQEGNSVLQKVLSDPNVYGAIFNNQTYGYGHGTTPKDYSAGHTGDPSQDHTNHVHVWYKPGGQGNIVPGAGGIPAMLSGNTAPTSAAALTTTSSPDDVAASIIAQTQARGFSRDQTIAVLSTAMQESGLSPTANGGGGAWHGIFQQDTSYPGRDDPNTNISTFLDRLGAPTGDIWAQIFGLQQGTPLGSSGARTAYLSEIQSQAGAATASYDRLAGAGGNAYNGGGVAPNLINAYGPGYKPGIGTPGVNEYGDPGYYETDQRRISQATRGVEDALQQVKDADQAITDSNKALTDAVAERDKIAGMSEIERKIQGADLDKANADVDRLRDQVDKANKAAGRSREDVDFANQDLAEANKGTFKQAQKDSGTKLSGRGLPLSSTFSGFGSAIGEFAGGQLGSALDVFGVGDSPPFLQAASQLLGGISIGGGGPLAANPLSGGAGVPGDGTQHGLQAGQAPGPVFNTTIQARDAEGAMEQWQRLQNQRMAAKTSVY